VRFVPAYRDKKVVPVSLCVFVRRFKGDFMRQV
jgi:hypothetical protein